MRKWVITKTLFYIMRIAITGLEVTPGGATEIAEILGKNECIARLNASLEKFFHFFLCAGDFFF